MTNEADTHHKDDLHTICFFGAPPNKGRTSSTPANLLSCALVLLYAMSPAPPHNSLHDERAHAQLVQSTTK